MDGWVPHLKGDLRTELPRGWRFRPRGTWSRLSDGSRIRYEHLISTMPLPVLIRQMGDEAPEAIRAAAGSLRYVSVRCVHIGVGRENVTEKHWIYYPGGHGFPPHFRAGKRQPALQSAGGFGLTCEITYSPHKPLPCDGDDLVSGASKIAAGSESSSRTIRFWPRPSAICPMPMWCTITSGRAAVERIRDMAGRARYHSGGPLQRVGILQFRPRFPGR